MGGKAAVCTIISKNYLAYARTFAESYLKHNKGGEVYVLLVDRLDSYFDPSKERFKLVELEELGIEGINELLFKYNVMELNTAVKPFFMEYLFKAYGLDKLVYFDPDIAVFDAVTKLWELLDTHSILLTPHVDGPYPDGLRPNEYDILLTGSYNLGFIALKNTGNVGEFLRWWQEKMRKFCYVDRLKGYFVDQKWIDLAPVMFENVHILKDPGCNIAYWNLTTRILDGTGDRYTVNGSPLMFFHFSGFSPDNIECISKHQNRYTLTKRQELRPLFERYRDMLIDNGYDRFIGWPYAFSTFDNGVEIPDEARKIYGYLPDSDAPRFGDPFKAGGDGSFFNWLNGKVGERGKHGVKRIWHEVYKRRADVQAMNPDIFADDWTGFMQWCLITAKPDFKMPDVFIPDEAEQNARRRIIDLTAAVEEKARLIEEKSRIIEEKAGIIEGQSRSIDELSEKIEKMALDIRSKEDTINTLINSLSWRITSPVRYLSSVAKGLAGKGRGSS